MIRWVWDLWKGDLQSGMLYGSVATKVIFLVHFGGCVSKSCSDFIKCLHIYGAIKKYTWARLSRSKDRDRG